jgi:ectoine hydroxylase-related dioxygenase (phytanoyl-CoA dioxygenase family)
MPTATSPRTISDAELESYHTDGYLIVRGMLSRDEVATLAEHYLKVPQRPSIAGVDGAGRKMSAGQPTDPRGHNAPTYPRLMQPHRYDDVSRRMILDRRIFDVLTDLMGEEPLAAQSMLFYKPPGTKGQAFHQDNFYLKVKPGTCVAAWVALDPTDEENGALRLIPGTQSLPLDCPHKPEDASEYFNNSEVNLPGGARRPVLARMAAGDVLFFGGSLIHGSLRNRSQTRWRRSLVLHYCPRSQTEQIGPFYQPLLTRDGREVRVDDAAADAGPCGGDEGNNPG